MIFLMEKVQRIPVSISPSSFSESIPKGTDSPTQTFHEQFSEIPIRKACVRDSPGVQRQGSFPFYLRASLQLAAVAVVEETFSAVLEWKGLNLIYRLLAIQRLERKSEVEEKWKRF